MIDKTVYLCYNYPLLGGFVRLILRWIRVIRMGVAAAVGFAGSAFVLLFLLVCRVVVVELGAEYHLGEWDGMLGHPPSPDRAEPALWVLRPVDFRDCKIHCVWSKLLMPNQTQYSKSRKSKEGSQK